MREWERGGGRKRERERERACVCVGVFVVMRLTKEGDSDLLKEDKEERRE